MLNIPRYDICHYFAVYTPPYVSMNTCRHYLLRHARLLFIFINTPMAILFIIHDISFRCFNISVISRLIIYAMTCHRLIMPMPSYAIIITLISLNIIIFHYAAI